MVTTTFFTNLILVDRKVLEALREPLETGYGENLSSKDAKLNILQTFSQ